jgi:hypothetical protein
MPLPPWKDELDEGCCIVCNQDHLDPDLGALVNVAPKVVGRPPRWIHPICATMRVEELEAALDRIASDRSLNRADCAVYAAEVRSGAYHVYAAPDPEG